MLAVNSMFGPAVSRCDVISPTRLSFPLISLQDVLERERPFVGIFRQNLHFFRSTIRWVMWKTLPRVLKGALQYTTTALMLAADGAHRASSSDRGTRKLWIHEEIHSTSWWNLSYCIQSTRNWTRTAVFEQGHSTSGLYWTRAVRVGVRRLVFAVPMGVQNFHRLSIYYSFCRS